MDWWLTVLGTVLSVAGIGYAWIQGVRLRQLRRMTNAEVWVLLRTTRSILQELQKSPTYEQDLHVTAAHGKAVELFRFLLNHAVQDERRYDETTILKWKAAGKIQGDWEEAQARQVLPTDAIQLRTLGENRQEGH